MGYIGGEVLLLLAKEQPSYHLIALVRNTEQAEVITTAYPAVETIIGDPESHDVLVEAAKRAVVVLRMFPSRLQLFAVQPPKDKHLKLELASADFVPSITSIISGPAQGKRGKYLYIHISGTAIINDMSTGPRQHHIQGLLGCR